ncbi:MAG: aminotransferase class I/II-fold pyridoxal phosphate-dependent enzyme [Clostridia bacterium]|nr:aminotransferase class I/II-fold pyridoxal phosphate-dependent enzyme [Clostridia bacterium]
MKKYTELDQNERKELYQSLVVKYNECKAKGLSLDLSRGKPNSIQLDICQGLTAVDMSRERCFSDGGFDCRNYGLLDGIPEMKEFFAEAYGLNKDDIVVGGNSSLQLMYDALVRATLFGVYGSPRPWSKEEKVKWLCVCPGYDRHFRITETLGFELINIEMLSDGPDMDAVERYAKDPQVKGIWCIPKYSNPSGNTYSKETVERLVSMECGAPDFRIMWDNAYGVHDFNEDGDELVNIFDLAEKYNNRDRIFYFSSTSKITFPGGGVAFIAASENNRKQFMPYLGAQTISYDKINQLRHLRFFEGKVSKLKEHMLKLGHEIEKKFRVALNALDTIKGLGIAEWTEPRGGYFISLDVMPGTAKRVYALMKEAGVTLTPVGATFPYGIDPKDRNIRLAPTYPSIEELEIASEILIIAVKLAALEKLGV